MKFSRVVEEVTEQIADVFVSDIETGKRVAGYLYHGSNRDDLKKLEPRHPPYKGGLGWGLYLAEKDEAAYYGKHIYRVLANIKNPFVIEPQPLDEFPWKHFGTTLAKAYEEHEFSPEFDLKWTDPFKQAREMNAEGDARRFYDWIMQNGTDDQKAFFNKFVAYMRANKTAAGSDWEKSSDYPEDDDGIADEIIDLLKDEWPGNEKTPILPDSVLTGEQVPPFAFMIGNTYHMVTDASDLEDISSVVRDHGYDAVVVTGLREHSPTPFNHEVVIFKSVVAKKIS